MGSDYIAELTSELESVINKEVMETRERILTEYQEKLSRIDEDATDKQLDFGTVDLIKGVLSNMRENAAAWCSDDLRLKRLMMSERLHMKKKYIMRK